jgi:hypothetical protein
LDAAGEFHFVVVVVIVSGGIIVVVVAGLTGAATADTVTLLLPPWMLSDWSGWLAHRPLASSRTPIEEDTPVLRPRT